MRISDWSSDVCSSDLTAGVPYTLVPAPAPGATVQVAGASVDGADPAAITEALRAAGYPAQADDAEINRPMVVVLIRSEEHTSELQSLMRISYALFCLRKKTITRLVSTITETVK